MAHEHWQLTIKTATETIYSDLFLKATTAKKVGRQTVDTMRHLERYALATLTNLHGSQKLTLSTESFVWRRA